MSEHTIGSATKPAPEWWRRTVAAVVLLAACAAGGTAQQIDTVASRQIAPGVVWRQLVARPGPWSINVVTADLRQPGLRLELLRADDQFHGRETVSSMVRRHDSAGSIVAAINADFFDLVTGESESDLVIDGEPWKGVPLTDSRQDHSHSVRSQLAITTTGKPVIERLAFAGSITVAGHQPVGLSALNFLPDTSGIAFYSARAQHPPVDSIGGRIALRMLAVVEHGGDSMYELGPLAMAEAKGRSGAITRGAVLASMNSAALDALGPRGTLVHVTLGFRPAASPLRLLVGGWPRLVVHGQSVADSADALEGTSPSFSVTRHPRTGVGFSRDSSRLILITIDGRQESSSGVSLTEFAGLMRTLGVYEGLNLDGGGSTTMVINGIVVNHPSDATGERAVGNALVVVVRPHD